MQRRCRARSSNAQPVPGACQARKRRRRPTQVHLFSSRIPAWTQAANYAGGAAVVRALNASDAIEITRGVAGESERLRAPRAHAWAAIGLAPASKETVIVIAWNSPFRFGSEGRRSSETASGSAPDAVTYMLGHLWVQRIRSGRSSLRRRAHAGQASRLVTCGMNPRLRRASRDAKCIAATSILAGAKPCAWPLAHELGRKGGERVASGRPRLHGSAVPRAPAHPPRSEHHRHGTVHRPSDPLSTPPRDSADRHGRHRSGLLPFRRAVGRHPDTAGGPPAPIAPDAS